MCSIAGATKKEEVEGMLHLMRHRAPDDEGIVENGLFLGMGRLAIIDLKSKGLCPIQYQNLTLVFNGELYNYLEIRDELEKLGEKFDTQSDSEVLLRAYKIWGTKCLDKFNWMGAFAISNGETIFLARDIAGEKPLYFTRRPFEFASEKKCFRTREGVEEFPPAHYGLYSLSTNRLTLERYWWHPKSIRKISLSEAVNELDILLADSIRLRTQSDVPYGLFYSGGIDSTLISTYHNFGNLFTYQDGNYQDEFRQVFPKILWHLDEPVRTFSPFGLWKLNEQAKENKTKVVLSGEGADELFGGYIRFVSNEFNRKAQ